MSSSRIPPIASPGTPGGPRSLRPVAPSLPGGDLPAAPGALLGRADDIAALAARLRDADTRLLTLTGPGGVGKTRLALAAARAAAPEFADGARFCDLSAVADPALLPAAIARALGLPPGDDPTTALIAALRDRDLLLVLDNLEQLRAGVGPLADVLAACPQLTILATSRVALRLRIEQRYPVAPLVAPDRPGTGGYAPAALRALADNPAVALFVARARAADPAFALTTASAPAVAALCARLDGLPLAIELAAARVAALSPAAILARLTSPLALPADAAPDRPARHHDLRATLAWSHALLSPPAQALFRRLGVTVDGATLDLILALAIDPSVPAPTAPLPDEETALAALAELVDASLVRRIETTDAGTPLAGDDPLGDTTRYIMLETIRADAAARLAASEEHDRVAARHAAHFVALAEAANPALYGPMQGGWLRRLGRDHENLRAALGWLADRGDHACGLSLAGALYRYWQHGRNTHEGLDWLTVRFTDDEGITLAVRGRAIHTAATLLYLISEFAAAHDRATVALALAARQGDHAAIARAHNTLGLAARGTRALTEAEARFTAALDHWRTPDGAAAPDAASGIASAINNLAALASDRGDYATAAAGYAEGVARQRASGDTNKLAQSLTALAAVRLHLGERAALHPLLDEGLTLSQSLGDWQTAARNLLVRAELALIEHHADRAARLVGAAVASRAVSGLALLALDPAQSIAAQVRATLGDTAYAAYYDEGASWPPEVAIAYALHGTLPGGGADPGPIASPPLVLSQREREVLPLLARGDGNQAIADQLHVSRRTVETHVASIIGKLGLQNRAQVGPWLAAHGTALPPAPH